MAIGQGNKIIASEINDSAATNFSQGAFIYANDIANLYVGTDNIAKGVLIRAEHFQNLNLGLPGSGGLSGYYDKVSFKKAEENGKILYDASSGILYLLTPGDHEIEFTNFGNLTSNVDIFMVGGGGMGNKDGLSGSGGFYNTFLNKTLVQSTAYKLKIGHGGQDGEQDAKSTGGNTTGFGFEVTGGYSGAAHIFKGYYREVAVYSHIGANVHYYDEAEGQDEYGNTIIDVANASGVVDNGTIVNIKCDQNGALESSNPVDVGGLDPEKATLLEAQDGTLYLVGSFDVNSNILTDIEDSQRPSNEPTATTIFTTTIWVSGYVEAVSNPEAGTDLNATRWGQGGGGSGVYGGSVYGWGGSGVIAIRKKI